MKDGEPTKDSLRFEVPSSNFKELPGSPYAYWISSALAKDFEKGEKQS